MELTGRVLVAGGSGALGARIAHELAVRGFAVAVHYREAADRAFAVVDSLRGGAPHAAVQADLLAVEGPALAVAGAETALGGPLTAVVNCAWPSTESRPIAETDQRLLEAALDGVRSHIALCRAAVPSLRRTAGSIVFLGGALAHRRHPALGLYSLAKAAAESACLTMALEEGRHGVRVNVIAPGRIDIGEGDLAESNPAFASLELIGAQRRALALPTPDDVARTAAFLVGPDSAAITGQVVAVSGGEQW